ncbi:beta-phosphoglucomutase [Fredinandcohnia humi]
MNRKGAVRNLDIVKAVIFDLDGIITDTAEYHYLAWREIAEELGIKIDRTFNEQLKGVGRMDSLNRILTFGNKNLSVKEKDYYAAKKNERYKELIKGIGPTDLLPGIEGFLQEIRDVGLKIGLASASKNAFTVIESLKIGSYFDTIVDAALVEKSKPDPEVFLRAAEQLQVPYSTCIGIEDAEAGVIAIKEAGMFAVGIGLESDLALADIVLPSTELLHLKQIIEIVEGSFGC